MVLTILINEKHLETFFETKMKIKALGEQNFLDVFRTTNLGQVEIVKSNAQCREIYKNGTFYIFCNWKQVKKSF